MLDPYALNSVPRLPQANSATTSAIPPAKLRGASSALSPEFRTLNYVP